MTTPPSNSMTTPPPAPQRARKPRRRMGGRKDDPPEVRLSKTLSYALRHGAVELGLEMRRSGYVELDALLRLPLFASVTEAQVEDVVRTNVKKRFSITTDASGAVKFIRANQGHTLAVVDDEELLTPLTDPTELPQCIHGTYRKFWTSIWDTGLCRMTRNHIHMTFAAPTADVDTATKSGNDSLEKVISGMRGNCDLLLFLDHARAMADGIKFYRSSNNVILSPGIGERGVIGREYFLKATLRDGTIVYERDEDTGAPQ